MTTFRVLALDPGGSTGWATFTCEVMRDPTSIGPDYKFEIFEQEWNCGTFDRPDHHYDLYNLLGHMHVQDYHIVCESFEYRNANRPGLDLSSKEYIGVAKLFQQSRPIGIQYTEQTASKAKGFVKDDNIRRLGLWGSGRENRHAMDAYRHLLFYLINNAKVKHLVADQLLRKGWVSPSTEGR